MKHDNDEFDEDMIRVIRYMPDEIHEAVNRALERMKHDNIMYVAHIAMVIHDSKIDFDKIPNFARDKKAIAEGKITQQEYTDAITIGALRWALNDLVNGCNSMMKMFEVRGATWDRKYEAFMSAVGELDDESEEPK
jgi:hypothetical protein